jgi:hypothetical protein
LTQNSTCGIFPVLYILLYPHTDTQTTQTHDSPCWSLSAKDSGSWIVHGLTFSSFFFKFSLVGQQARLVRTRKCTLRVRTQHPQLLMSSRQPGLCCLFGDCRAKGQSPDGIRRSHKASDNRPGILQYYLRHPADMNVFAAGLRMLDKGRQIHCSHLKDKFAQSPIPGS